MLRAWLPAPLLTAVVLSSGCATWRDVRFGPEIQDAELRGEADAVEARLAVAWRGIHARDETLELRYRLSVENPGFTPFTLVPATFELFDAALAPIGVARVDALPPAVEPGRSATFDIAFAVPREPGLDRFDLSALHLRTRFQGERWHWSTTFERVERIQESTAPDPHMTVGFGVVLGGR